jgi:hypothetical protein
MWSFKCGRAKAEPACQERSELPGCEAPDRPVELVVDTPYGSVAKVPFAAATERGVTTGTAALTISVMIASWPSPGTEFRHLNRRIAFERSKHRVECHIPKHRSKQAEAHSSTSSRIIFSLCLQ